MGDRFRSLSLLVAITFIITIFGSVSAAMAIQSFHFIGLYVETDQGLVPVQDLDEVDRNLNRLVVRFSGPLDFATAADAIRFTDEAGNEVPIRQDISYGADSSQTVRERLLPATTYTLVVRGGPQGVQDQAGNTLSADVTLRFRTNSAPAWQSAHPQLSFDRYGVRQGDSFAFTAAQGPLQFRMGLAEGSAFLVMLEGPEPNQILVSRLLNQDEMELRADLPRGGRYNLVVSPLWGAEPSPGRFVALSAGDLDLPGPTVPGLTMRSIALFETMNQPFELAAGLIPPSTAERLTLLIDGELVRENLLEAEGRVAEVVIDPSSLEDGVHQLILVGKSVGSESMSALARPFFVDLVDTFVDLPSSHWARKPVEFMSHLGILQGRGQGRFEPGAPVTRAEFAKMVALSVQLDEPEGQAPQFVDLPTEHWGKGYIDQLAGLGLLKGEEVAGQRYFHPDRTITRAEAATIIGRILGVAEADRSELGLDDAELGLVDGDQVPAWALSSVLMLRQMGWIDGFPDGTYRPGQTLQRDQAAKILAKFAGL